MCCYLLFPQWACLRIWIVTSHEDHVFHNDVFVLDVNRDEVVEVLDISFSPPDREARYISSLCHLLSIEGW